MSTSHNASHDASHNAKHQQAIETSRRYLNTIKSKTISRAAAEELIAETLRNFANHYNPGFLEYRKSVTRGRRLRRGGVERARRHLHRRAGPHLSRLPRRLRALESRLVAYQR